MLARCLLILACGFAALSSSTAAELGLEEERITVFSGLVALLLLVPHLKRPRLEEPDGLVMGLLLLLPALAAHDALSGRVDPVDYKVVLPILALVAAPGLARELGRERVVPLAWWLLSFYAAGTFAYRLVAEPAAVARGYGSVVRYDPTGSVVMHASLSVIHLTMALARAAAATRVGERAVSLALGALALVMVLQSATRTVIVTLALFACFAAATARDKGAVLGRTAAAGLGLGLVFLAYSLLWEPSFLLRLTSAGEEGGDYASGRLPSIAFWLGLAGERPFGLGFGAVRELLADGKPWLDGASTLEWPHNEFVRFYVEAGPVGLAFALLLVAAIARTALRAAARCPDDPVRRALLLAVAADVVAESCLQNLFNAVHHATVLALFLALAASARSARSTPPPATNRPGQVPAPAPT